MVIPLGLELAKDKIYFLFTLIAVVDNRIDSIVNWISGFEVCWPLGYNSKDDKILAHLFCPLGRIIRGFTTALR